MPSDWLWMDSAAPPMDDSESAEQKIQKLQTYIYMLAQQLRYTLQNLGAANFNSTEWTEWNTSKAAAEHRHTFDDMTGAAMPVYKGGTGAMTAEKARKNLGIQTGTWTPEVTGAAAYTEQKGQYVRIGNMVIASFQIRCDAADSSAEIKISGLPYSVADEAAGGGICSAGGLNGSMGFAGYFKTAEETDGKTFGPRMNNAAGALAPVTFGSGASVVLAGNLIYTAED